MRYLVIHLLYSLLTNIVDIKCRISFFTVIRRFISVLDKEAKVLELISRENSKKFMRMTSARSMDFVSFTGNLGKYIYRTCQTGVHIRTRQEIYNWKQKESIGIYMKYEIRNTLLKKAQ